MHSSLSIYNAFINLIIIERKRGELNMERKSQNTSNIDTRVLVYIGIMAAITYVATAMINLKTFMGVVHLGDSMVLLGAILLGKKKGAISAAIGMTLFDLLSGYVMWAPFTFVIKAIMAFIVGSIAFRKDYEGKNILNNLFSFILAAVWMICGYFVTGIILAKITMESPTIAAAVAIAAKDIIGNIGQGFAAIVIALPLSITLKGKIKL